MEKACLGHSLFPGTLILKVSAAIIRKKGENRSNPEKEKGNSSPC